MYAGGRQIRVLQERAPGDVDWGELGCDIVIEATGKFRSRAELTRHLEKGAHRVVLTVPPVDGPDQVDVLVVMGVNDEVLTPATRIVSNASCTDNALAALEITLSDVELGLGDGTRDFVRVSNGGGALVIVGSEVYGRFSGSLTVDVPGVGVSADTIVVAINTAGEARQLAAVEIAPGVKIIVDAGELTVAGQGDVQLGAVVVEQFHHKSCTVVEHVVELLTDGGEVREPGCRRRRCRRGG